MGEAVQQVSNLTEIPEAERTPFGFEIPGTLATTTTLSWKMWAAYHQRLGQELAKRMRGYAGPSTEDDVPPEGGTPVLMRMAA